MTQKAKNKTKDQEKKDYDCENKNRIREIIVSEIRKRNISSILTLESKDFLFSKMLPDKKIIVFEKEGDICTKMEKCTPKNVELIFGNIGKFGIFNSTVDCIYLDFCKTWMTEQEVIAQLIDSLGKTKLFILTLSTRVSGYHKESGNVFLGDYQFDLINKIQQLTNINWRVVYGESYYDSSQMVTIIMENG